METTKVPSNDRVAWRCGLDAITLRETWAGWRGKRMQMLQAEPMYRYIPLIQHCVAAVADADAAVAHG